MENKEVWFRFMEERNYTISVPVYLKEGVIFRLIKKADVMEI